MVVGIEQGRSGRRCAIRSVARRWRAFLRRRVGGVEVQLDREKQRQRRLHGKRQRRKRDGCTTSEEFSVTHQRVDIWLTGCIPALPWR